MCSLLYLQHQAITEDLKMTITITINQLSVLINMAVKTIRSTLVRNPKALPPRLLIPGQRKLLWLRSDVEKFYENQNRAQGSNPNFANLACSKSDQTLEVNQEVKRRRGRPRKVNQIKSGGVTK